MQATFEYTTDVSRKRRWKSCMNAQGHKIMKAIWTRMGEGGRSLRLWSSKCVSHSVLSDSLWPRGLELARFLCPWGFPGKNPGVGWRSPSTGDLPNPGIEPRSPALQALWPSKDLGYFKIKIGNSVKLFTYSHKHLTNSSNYPFSKNINYSPF